ncbi:MAG: HWE histidine kinase domain-containing protein [Roseiarcus sp.]|jgi:two-component sensor histidine kinase
MGARDTRTLLRRLARWAPSRPPTFWRGQAVAVICVAAGTALRSLLDPLVHEYIPVVVFYPFVLVASVWGGSLAGLSALVLSAAVADYLWLPPLGSFAINASSAITLTAFVVVCLFGIFVASLLRALVEVHAEGEQRAILLAHEMKHRAGNLLGVVIAISGQTARGAASVAEHQALFTARLTALARAQQLGSDEAEAAPELREFLRQVVEPFGADRFVLEGPAVSAPVQLGPSFALLLHELSTNAVKYGALSGPRGTVAIKWETREKFVRLDWREIDGPPVARPARAGFGSRLLKTAFPSEYGQATMSFDPDGVRCTVYFARL